MVVSPGPRRAGFSVMVGNAVGGEEIAEWCTRGAHRPSPRSRRPGPAADSPDISLVEKRRIWDATGIGGHADPAVLGVLIAPFDLGGMASRSK